VPHPAVGIDASRLPDDLRNGKEAVVSVDQPHSNPGITPKSSMNLKEQENVSSTRSKSRVEQSCQRKWVSHSVYRIGLFLCHI
jgi:hypothetical protein